MRVVCDTRLSVQENAKAYYEKAKKQRGKIAGMEKAIADSLKKIESAPEEGAPEARIEKRRERRWYEAFRWFLSSDGYLVIGGRDATSNEVLVKKHLEANDMVFHADIQGAPFFIVKNDKGAEVPEKTVVEAAEAAAAYSKAWGRGLGAIDVYRVSAGQVSKTPPAGEHLTKGAFMVYGEKAWHKNVQLKVAIGVADEGVIGGPVSAVTSKAEKIVVVAVGDVGQGTLAKSIRARLGGDLDDIQRFLPAGGGKMV